MVTTDDGIIEFDGGDGVAIALAAGARLEPGTYTAFAVTEASN